MADSIVTERAYCPPYLKLKRTLRTERTVYPGIREASGGQVVFLFLLESQYTCFTLEQTFLDV